MVHKKDNKSLRKKKQTGERTSGQAGQLGEL